MKKHCKTLILGSTFAGLGYLLTHEDAILIEETELIGSDFCGIFRPSAQISAGARYSMAVNAFKTYCEENLALTGTATDIFRLSPATYRYFSEHAKGRIYFDTSLVSIEARQSDDGFCHAVTVRSNEGISVISAEQILDATALRISDRSGAKEIHRTLHAFSTDLNHHAVTAKPKSSLLGARESLEAYNLQHDDVQPYACVGFDFEYCAKATAPIENEGILWLNPADYQTPFDAMEAGATAEIASVLTYGSDGIFDGLGDPDCEYYELRENRVSHYPAVALFEKSYDFIVCGLGAGGSFASLSAAKERLSVLGLERGACVGGMGVQGCVSNYYNSYEGGSYEEADRKAAEKEGTVYAKYTHSSDAKKVSLEAMLQEAGVELSFHSVVLGVYRKGAQVIGAKVLQNGTVHDYGCSFIADGTSDGHLLRILGVKGSIGRLSDGKTQPFTSVSISLKDNGALAHTNEDSGRVDPYNDESLSNAILRAHGGQLEFINKPDRRFLYVAPMLGIREGMMMEAEETLTLSDILDERKPEKPLFAAYSDIDKHGEDRAFEEKVFQDWFTIANLSTITWKVLVPLGAVVPKGLTGIVSVSRCIGADNYASAAVRMTRDMYRMGESVGVFVALAVKNGSASVLDVPFETAHEIILERGCYDPRPNEWKGFMVWGDGKPKRYVPVEWMTEWNDIKSALATNCPGVAIWSAHRIAKGLGAFTVNGKAIPKEEYGTIVRELLFETIKEKLSQDLTYACAIVLGLLEDDRCIPILREMVRNRDAFFYLDCRRSNQLRCVSAILLLSRFGDEEILPELYKILTPEEYYRPMYHKYMADCYKLCTEKEMSIVYYYYFETAVGALTALMEKLPHRREEILKVLRFAVHHETLEGRMTEFHGAPKGSILEERVEGLREWVERLH